jgi:CheY-like chemotaxis protein
MNDDKPISILLVEDNPGDVRLIQENFADRRIAAAMRVAKDGVEALQFLRREGAYSNAAVPDMIVLDLNLPKKDGGEVLSEIKNDDRLKRIPVVVLTSSEKPEDVAKAYGLHASCYILKPVKLDDFIGVVRAIESFWNSTVKLPREKTMAEPLSLNVLLIEDNPGDVSLVGRALSEAPGGAFQVTHAETLSKGFDRLAQGAIDVILLDLTLPDSLGLPTLTRVRARTALPIVVMTGLDHAEISSAALGQGAQDYLIKGRINADNLSRSLRHAIANRLALEEAPADAKLPG